MEPGAALNRDISRSLAVDAENDAFIERRHNRRVQEEGERLEARLKPPDPGRTEARRAEIRRCLGAVLEQTAGEAPDPEGEAASLEALRGDLDRLRSWRGRGAS